MKCSRLGCNDEGLHRATHASQLYCNKHITFLRMRNSARHSNKAVPTFDELNAMLPNPMVCPCCDKHMQWIAPKRGDSPSLQHWPDGTMTIICHQCNTRLRSYDRLPQAGHKRCSRCKEIKPFHLFHASKRGYYGLHNQCKECRLSDV